MTSSQNSFVFSPHRFTVGIGLHDVIIVDTPDALLVANRKDLGALRGVVEAMAADYYPEVNAESVHVNVSVPKSSRGSTLATQIFLDAGEILSREPHHELAHHWIVLEGSVKVTIGAVVSTYLSDQSFHVPPGDGHHLKSCGGIPAKLIEGTLRTRPYSRCSTPTKFRQLLTISGSFSLSRGVGFDLINLSKNLLKVWR